MKALRVIVLALISVSAAAQTIPPPRSVAYMGPVPRATLAYSWRVPSLYQIATFGVAGFWTQPQPSARRVARPGAIDLGSGSGTIYQCLKSEGCWYYNSRLKEYFLGRKGEYIGAGDGCKPGRSRGRLDGWVVSTDSQPPKWIY